jgi:hypothetical protein
MKRLFTVTVAMLCAAAAPAWAFPLDGTYFAECAGEGAGDGVGAEGALEARLTFPEICFDGACCDLSNPTRLAGCLTSFSMTGPARAEGEAFEARIFFGAGPDAPASSSSCATGP